jgi:hypothetical protein
MSTFESLSHSRWDCKYHVVFVPKCRKKALYEDQEISDVLQEFWITKMFAADERRHAAIPKTVAMIRFWAMISPLLMPWSCPLRIMCITSVG